MTFETKTLEVGRRAANIVELDLDRCSRSYGVAPCTADLALQNLATNSENIDSGGWTKTDITTSPNVVANPINGAVTADRMIEGVAAASQHRLERLTSGAALRIDQAITASAHVQIAVGTRWAQLVLYEGANVVRAWFNVDEALTGSIQFEGAAGSGTFKMHAMPDYPGWFRLIATGILDPADAVPQNVNLGVQFSDGDGSTVFNGDGASAFNVFGLQIRQGEFAGFYAANTGTNIDGMGAVDDACYNTFDTCQDTPNYLNAPQTYRFIDRLNIPTLANDAFPAVKSVSYGATKLDPGGGLAIRGKVTVSLQDFTANDVTLDDYARERTYDAESQGTFFGRLLARNKFWLGRPMRVLEGYIDEPFSLTNFRTREYIIENIVGPDKTGKVQIIGKDPLTLAANDKAKCPEPSVGTLAVAMASSGTSCTVSAGTGPDYDVDQHIRIDDEIMSISSRAIDVLTVARSQGGTTPAAHSVGAAVQSCKSYDDEPVIDIVQELLEDFANVPPSFIPFADWQAEEAASLSGYDLTTIISEPTGVQKLLKEIVEITLLDIWYSDTDQEIKLKLQTPFTDVTQVLNDDYNVLEKSLKVTTSNTRRLTRVLIYYGIRNFARDLTETENYSLANFEIEADKEAVNKFNDQKIKVLFSRWMDSSNTTQIELTSQRLLERFGNMPVEILFNLDAKDVPDLQTGDVYDLETRAIQGVDGLPARTRMQVIETKPVKPSSQYRYQSLAFFTDPVVDAIVIAADETDYNLFVELGGPPGAVDVTVTINAAVRVSASSRSAPAFSTEGMHPDSTVKIINNGEVYGAGGPGGTGGDALVTADAEGGCTFGGSVGNGDGGGTGGDAIECTVAAIEIDNTNGEIFGGGGGGGGGKGWRSSVAYIAYGGGGGGGARGDNGGPLGAGGDATNIDLAAGCGPPTLGDGADGTAGTDLVPGTGGAAGGAQAFAGADGGDWGVDGDDPIVGGSGGAAGFAVRLNGAVIVWLGGNDPASVKGNVA